MKLKYINVRFIKVAFLVLFAIIVTSCKKYVDIPIAPNMIANADVFKTDASATSAVLSMYSYSYMTTSIGYFTYLGGLASDELQTTSSDASLQEFAQSAVTTTNSYVLNYLWSYPYTLIRWSNLAIDGITNSTTLTPATKSQLLGEAKFFRAFIYFHVVNYIGNVPLELIPTPSSNKAQSLPADVWKQIISDLKDAESLLPSAYAGIAAQRGRVNKYAAAALLARAYLYTKDYTNAETESSNVIGASDITYSLAPLANTFISTSPETILQFSTLYGYSTFGSAFRTSSSANNVAPPSYVLYPGFTNSFEAGDQRKVAWVDSTTYNAKKYYRINKYKLNTATAGNEYSVILRLAEQYLIRAEARAQINTNLAGAQADLNKVRNRAGLANTTASTQSTLLTAIANERKVELFGEFSHRWFDLVRTGQANTVIGALKSTTWKSTAVLMPVPYSQILLNTNLIQNTGY